MERIGWMVIGDDGIHMECEPDMLPEWLTCDVPANGELSGQVAYGQADGTIEIRHASGQTITLAACDPNFDWSTCTVPDGQDGIVTYDLQWNVPRRLRVHGAMVWRVKVPATAWDGQESYEIIETRSDMTIMRMVRDRMGTNPVHLRIGRVHMPRRMRDAYR